MEYINKIIKRGEANGGYVLGWEIEEGTNPRVYLARMVKQGILSNLSQGIYLLSGYLEDEIYTYALRYNRAVFSRHTALYLNGMMNRQLEYVEANFPRNYNTARICEIKCYRTSDELYELGETVAITPLGHKVNSYNIERCICDLFYYDDFDIEEKSFAIKSVDKSKLNYDRLFAYAKKMKVLSQVKSVFEVI